MPYNYDPNSQVLEGPPDPLFTVCIPPVERINAGSDGFLDQFALPGEGFRGEGCGELLPYFSKAIERSFWINSHCNQRSCPRCFERWGQKEAHSAAKRIAWGAKVVATARLDAAMAGDLRICHTIVSLKEHPGKCVSSYRQDAYRIFKDHNIVGGAVVVHPFRKDDYDAEFTLDGYVHFHCPGVNFENIPEGGQDVDSEGELAIFKHIPDKEYGDFRGFRSELAIEREIQYLLSHAGVAEGIHSLTYFGSLSPVKLSAAAIETVFQESLTDGSKADPDGGGPEDPVSGSHDTEPCYSTDFCRKPSLAIPGKYDYGDYVSFRGQDHPDPEFAGSPAVLEERRTAIKEEAAFQYEIEPDFETRKSILKERRRRLRKLDRQESIWLNYNDPFVRLWAAIYAILSDGLERLDGQVWKALSPDELHELLRLEQVDGYPDPLGTLIAWNVKSGRLEQLSDGRVRLNLEYGLRGALAELRDMHFSAEGRGDWRLGDLLRAYRSDENEILSSTGFIFGSYLVAAAFQERVPE